MIPRSILLIVLAVTIVSSVYGLGVAPSRTETFFEPLGESEISIKIINSEQKDLNVNLLAKGDLEQYISIPAAQVHISPEESEKLVTYRIRFPEKMEPGITTGEIWIVESSVGSKDIQANIGVAHRVTVRAPYPDKYLEGFLVIGETKPEQPAMFTVLLSNVGQKDLASISGGISITDGAGKEIASLITDEISLKSKEKGKVTSIWTVNATPGMYHAKATISYDGKAFVLDKDFDIGEPLIDIGDAVAGAFRLGTIARFEIMLENRWNQEIRDIYGKTEILDNNGGQIDSFKTSNINLAPHTSDSITSYWDTQGINPGRFFLNVRTFYFGRTKEKTYALDVKKDRIEVKGALTGEVISEVDDSPLNMTGLILAGALGLGLIAIMAFIKLSKRNNEDHSKRNACQQTGMNGQLKDYIANKLKEGYSPQVLRERLLDKGWSRETIDREMMRLEDELAAASK